MKKTLLKSYRESIGISSLEASNVCGVPLRTYQRYEQDDSYGNKLKRNAIFDIMKKKYEITEKKGLLKFETIKTKVGEVLDKHKDEIEFCYLFGSYAKGYAKEDSDVDLCIATRLKGLSFIALAGELRESLNKNIDLLRLSDIQNNTNLLSEIMKDGIKIYG